MKHTFPILQLCLGLCAALFVACADEAVTPKPIKPDIDLGERMGSGQLFDRLSALPSVSYIQAVRNLEYHPQWFDEEYQFYVEQLIDPSHPATGTFLQKCRIAHRGTDCPTVMVTEGYALEDKDSASICTNYAEDTPLDSMIYLYQGEEIARMLGANMLVVEHRYFHSSNPDPRDWQHLSARNASADLHHIFDLLKPIYPRKWLSTGVSKGGITAMLYHMMYPTDMDAVVPYCAPMCHGINDDRPRDYIRELAADSALRAEVLRTKQMVIDSLFHPLQTQAYCNEYRRLWRSQMTDLEVIGQMLATLIPFEVTMWNNSNHWATDIMPSRAERYNNREWIVNWLAKMDLAKEYRYGSRDKEYHQILIDPYKILGIDTRVTIYDYEINPDGTTSMDKGMPYLYMAVRELGQEESVSTEGLNLPQEWQEWADSTICTPFTPQSILSVFAGFPASAVPTYSDALYNECIQYFQQHDPRVIFIYGANDYWTGCGICDVWSQVRTDRHKYPTFGFAQKQQMCCYLVPGRGHDAKIQHLPQREEVWNKLKQWMK